MNSNTAEPDKMIDELIDTGYSVMGGTGCGKVRSLGSAEKKEEPVFYKKFIYLCELNGKKPSPVLKELGLSSGNIKRWKNGASVNADTLVSMSRYFDVPVDYFFNKRLLLCDECRYYYFNKDGSGVCTRNGFALPFPKNGFCSYAVKGGQSDEL